MPFIYQKNVDEKEIKRKLQPSLLEEMTDYFVHFLSSFFFVAVALVFIKTSVFDIFTVSGTSMFPTYENGNQVYIDRLSPKFSEYRRGDVVILRIYSDKDGHISCHQTADSNPIYYIKRIIALPGDTLKLENGRVMLFNPQFAKGVLLNETAYIAATTKTYKLVTTSGETAVEPTLQNGEFYVMGDNRTGSKDSRMIGPCQRQNILGREIFRLTPPTKRGLFQVPSYGPVPN